jgi:CRP-like cAMP-binding protein
VDFEVLGDLSVAEQKLVLAQCVERQFSRGDTVVGEGDVGEEFFLIVSGRVALRVTTPAGEAVTLSVLGAGQAFGEMALVGNRRRTATAIALEPLTALAMSTASFESLRRRHPAVDRLLLDILASRVDRLSRELSEALYVPVETRLARRLLALGGIYRTPRGPTVLPLTQEDIAGIVGTSRPTVNQMLKRMANDGIVELGRGTVRIVDAARLRELADAD